MFYDLVAKGTSKLHVHIERPKPDFDGLDLLCGRSSGLHGDGLSRLTSYSEEEKKKKSPEAQHHLPDRPPSHHRLVKAILPLPEEQEEARRKAEQLQKLKERSEKKDRQM